MSTIKYIISILLLGVLAVILINKVDVTTLYANTFSPFVSADKIQSRMFPVQSIDTMKQSRDMSAQVLTTPSAYTAMIDSEMTLIKNAGATHVAIDTPYDSKFLPVLELWVASARAHGLSVWFRGNFSGWEGWFDYSSITRDQHKQLLAAFLKDNSNLFRNGDIFTPCPECENGSAGDPRKTGDVTGYQNFLIDEYNLSNQAFKNMGKSVTVYNSMNADIAKILTPQAVQSLGGTILIDHYSPSVAGFSQGIVGAQKLGTNVGIGEFGAPIPDLNGDMTESQQSDFVGSLLQELYQRGTTTPIVNYWDLEGGSTALTDDGTPRAVYAVLQSYFTAPSIYGTVLNSIGQPQVGVRVSVASTTYAVTTDANGFFQIFLPVHYRTVTFSESEYTSTTTTFSNLLPSQTKQNFILEPSRPTPEYTLKKMIYSIKQ